MCWPCGHCTWETNDGPDSIKDHIQTKHGAISVAMGPDFQYYDARFLDELGLLGEEDTI